MSNSLACCSTTAISCRIAESRSSSEANSCTGPVGPFLLAGAGIPAMIRLGVGGRGVHGFKTKVLATRIADFSPQGGFSLGIEGQTALSSTG